eukprot:CAMPEP_0174829894 /NCGR_PEP_ID=MMETSP1114-20130205/2216_1 /TAXON_ID=312471 /ORGANISM="Neobodo designis, Strain CCAP 1951/1" /LENGTH=463 /DNA_ID=CAMNT_0016063671 /DNA_START=31 /DNA_END=1419 /DNA_ORIENTATION=+
MSSLDAALDERGLAEYKAVLVKNGLSTLADLRGVTEADLAAIGIDKLFHRKRLLQIAAEEEAKAKAPATASTASGSGDHIRVELLGARGGETPLTERDYYAKVSLCDRIGHDIYPIENTVVKSGRARGPQPVWPVTEKTAIRVKTTFRSHCLALELKEHHRFSENKLVGVLILPIAHFRAFTSGYVEDTWHMLRREADEASEVTGSVHLRLSVPGGCPKNVGPAFHVTAVQMTARKLRVTVFDASIVADAANEPGSPKKSALPNLYVSLHVDSTREDGEHFKAKTKVVPHCSTPSFDQSFEFSAEVGQCKLMTVKLKAESGAVITTSDVIGTVRIPIQYFLAQRHPPEVDEVFAAIDEAGKPCARVHMRLQVVPLNAPPEAPAGTFRRTDSLPSQHSDVDVDAHPAFSPKRAPGSRSGTPSNAEVLQPKFVSDTDEEEEEDRAMAAAARRNQRAASQGFGRHQ